MSKPTTKAMKDLIGSGPPESTFEMKSTLKWMTKWRRDCWLERRSEALVENALDEMIGIHALVFLAAF